MVAARSGITVARSLAELAPDRFREACSAQGLGSVQSIADFLDIDRNTVRRWLEGDTTPLLDQALDAARRLKTTVDHLWSLRTEVQR